MIFVLYSNDNPGDLATGRSSLEQSGRIAITPVSSAGELARSLDESTFDAVILEYNYAGRDAGCQLRQIRERYPLLPVLIFSTESAAEVILDALNSGADFYLQKQDGGGSQYADLAYQVTSAVRRRRPVKEAGHLARLYCILSKTITASASLRGRRALLEETCRIAVDDGGFLLVWIGLIHPQTGHFEPVASSARSQNRGHPHPQPGDVLPIDAPPAGIAVSKGLYYASIDNRTDPLLAPWKEWLVEHGFYSSAAFPLRVGDRVIGAMTFHAGEPRFFSEEEVQLLTELTDNLSLSFELMEKEYNISELVRLSEALRLANRKLNLLSDITRHDTLNQLTGLAAYIELARLRTEDARMLETLKKMCRATDTIRQHISFTREYQDIGVQTPLWQDLKSTIGRAINAAGPVPAGISGTVEEIEIYADPLLEKVFFNLIENAVSHGKTMSRISFSAHEAGDQLVIVCEDDGAGVPAEEKENIFRRRYYKNTGFGLFLSREILAITGIGIRETGVLGTGARFEILVPEQKYRIHSRQVT